MYQEISRDKISHMPAADRGKKRKKGELLSTRGGHFTFHLGYMFLHFTSAALAMERDSHNHNLQS